jgi:uncharacterized protein (DUF3820 family)
MEIEIVYTDSSVLTFGEYKFTSLIRVPPKYLLDIYKTKNYPDKALITYIKENLDNIKARQSGELPTPRIELACKKLAYPTRKAARIALKDIRVKAERSEQKHKIPIRPYECDRCSGWHLTSMTKEKWEEEKNA